jgi:hypothetical protein
MKRIRWCSYRLRFAQNDKNTKFSFLIQKDNPNSVIRNEEKPSEEKGDLVVVLFLRFAQKQHNNIDSFP